MAKKLIVTQIRSTIGHQKARRGTIRALGLKRISQSVEHEDRPEIRGMIQKVRDLVKVEEA